jgi:hypothetical protein
LKWWIKIPYLPEWVSIVIFAIGLNRCRGALDSLGSSLRLAIRIGSALLGDGASHCYSYRSVLLVCGEGKEMSDFEVDEMFQQNVLSRLRLTGS